MVTPEDIAQQWQALVAFGQQQAVKLIEWKKAALNMKTQLGELEDDKAEWSRAEVIIKDDNGKQVCVSITDPAFFTAINSTAQQYLRASIDGIQNAMSASDSNVNMLTGIMLGKISLEQADDDDSGDQPIEKDPEPSDGDDGPAEATSDEEEPALA